jgi:hypothetical protein
MEAFEPLHGLSLSSAVVRAYDAFIRPVAQRIGKDVRRGLFIDYCFCGGQ